MEICKKKFLFNAGSQFISISIFSSQYEKVLTVVILGLDLVCSQFLSTLFCYEKKLSLVLLLYSTSFWRGWNILLYLSGICCITISGTANMLHKFLEGMEYPPVPLVPVWNV
jgi:hypothetical protein